MSKYNIKLVMFENVITSKFNFVKQCISITKMYNKRVPFSNYLHLENKKR